jgi:hypothetical protein
MRKIFLKKMKKRIIKKRQTIKQKEEGNKQTYYQK